MRKLFVLLALSAGLGACASTGTESSSMEENGSAQGEPEVRTVCRNVRSSGSSTGSRVNSERVCETVIETAAE